MNTIYVLVLFLSSTSQYNSTNTVNTQEFSSQEFCTVAGQAVQKLNDRFKFICVKK